MKIAFNTGAHYTSHGQRIGAWVERVGEQEFACFVDFDRMVSGYFPFVAGGDGGGTRTFQTIVMNAYNYGQYNQVYIEGMHGKLNDVRHLDYDCFIADRDCIVLSLQAWPQSNRGQP